MAAQSRTIVGWGLRLIVAAILAVGAIPKFTGGSAALADKIPGGSLAVTGIGVAEVLAVLMILMPRTSRAGAALAALLMLGALGSHIIGPVGLEGDFFMMFFMALAAFLAAAGFLALSRTAGGS
jgi:hypothetical protein